MSDDPVRLRDDPRVSNALRRDLARASQGGAAAPGFDVAAALASFEAAKAASSGPSGSGSASHGLSLASRTGRWWGVGAIGVATALAAVMWTVRPWRSVSVPAVAPIVAPQPAPNAPTSSVESPNHGPLPVASEPADAPRARASGATGSTTSGNATGPSTTREPLEPALRSASTTAIPPGTASSDAPSGSRHAVAAAQPATPVAGDDLLARDERMMVDTYALLEMDPTRALSLANAGIRAFPDSQHVQEREAVAVRALASLHRSADARARGAAFLARWPSGPHASMVRQAMMR